MTRFSFGPGRLLLLLGLLACAGCGQDKNLEDRLPLAPASGVVTYGGQPVAGATVTFTPQEPGKPSAYGKTDAQGRFKMQTYEVDDGAVAGDHNVTIVLVEITVPEGNPDDPDYDPETAPPVPPPKSLIPEKYNRPNTSGLTAVVEAGGKNEFTFPLED